MKEFVTNLGKDNYITGIASLSSILGLILSFIIILLTIQVNSKVNKKLRKYSDIESFNKCRIKYRDRLKFIQMLIQKDDIFKPEIAMEILDLIGSIENHESILSLKDQIHIWILKWDLRYLNQVNKYKIGKKLSYFIRKCEKKEVHFYE